MMKLKPKYVKRANMYVIHEDLGEVKSKNTTKREQKQHWFSSLGEACCERQRMLKFKNENP